MGGMRMFTSAALNAWVLLEEGKLRENSPKQPSRIAPPKSLQAPLSPQAANVAHCGLSADAPGSKRDLADDPKKPPSPALAPLSPQTANAAPRGHSVDAPCSQRNLADKKPPSPALAPLSPQASNAADLADEPKKPPSPSLRKTELPKPPHAAWSNYSTCQEIDSISRPNSAAEKRKEDHFHSVPQGTFAQKDLFLDGRVVMQSLQADIESSTSNTKDT